MQEFSVAELSKILSAVFKNAFPDMIAVTGSKRFNTPKQRTYLF